MEQNPRTDKRLLYPDGEVRRAVPYEAQAVLVRQAGEQAEALLVACIWCQARHGQPHGDDCPAESCPRCGCQLVRCGCMHPGLETIGL